VETTIFAAVIAGSVSLLAAAAGACVAYISASWTAKLKLQELDFASTAKKRELEVTWELKQTELELKKVEIERLGDKLRAEAEQLQQTVMRDVLASRMKAYAALWRVMITYERNWVLEGKQLDAKWAGEFLVTFNACNAEHGVYFSEAVYTPFFRYRDELTALVARTKAGETLAAKDLSGLVMVSSSMPGNLAAAMKNDLGSYIRPVLRA
jgi:hypothetical protein